MESKIEALISPTLISMGYNIVRLRLLNTEAGDTLQIMAEHIDGRGINVDECSKISRTVSAILDVEDPIENRYLLEVSSPGMERPLVKLGDFEKFAGKDAKITTHQPINGRKKFKGVIKSLEGETVKFNAIDDNNKTEEISIQYNDIVSANLIVTNESLRKILNKQN